MQGVQMRTAGDRAVLSLMGDVGYEITASAVAKALKDAGGVPLTVSLNSYGGDAAMGIAIHNMIARYPGTKTVVVEGIAASAASLIAMAGDEIVMPANAFLMIHEAWGGAMGDADAMRSMAETLDMVSASYRRTYAARTGKSEDDVAALMAAETWFTADAALEAGFATKVSEPAEVRADARRLARFNKVPAALSAPAQVITPPAAPAPTATQEVCVTEVPNQAPVQAATPIPAPVAQPAAPQAATLAEIQAIAARARLGAEFVVAQLGAGATVEAARDAAIDAIAAAAPVLQPLAIQVLADEGDKFRARAAGAMTAMTLGQNPAEDEREFVAMGLHGIIREILARRGERQVHRLNAEQLAHRVLASGEHTTSDFAGILTNSTNKSLRTMFAAYPNTWSAWVNEIEVADFKTITAASVGQFPEPQTFPEAGPVPAGTVGEEWETYAVQERGVLIGLSFAAIVNDDLNAFNRIIQSASLGAYTALRRRIFGILTANGNMRDGTAIFAAGRGNLGTAGAMTATALRELYQLLAQQVTPTRAQPSAQVPSTGAPLPPPTSMALLMPPAKFLTGLELVSNLIVPTSAGNALPAEFRSMITPVQEAFLNTGNGPYYLARTEPSMRPVEVAYLRGRRAPSVTSAEQITTTGITYRMIFNFEAAPVTARTIAANLG